jgi:hypothetical protein
MAYFHRLDFILCPHTLRCPSISHLSFRAPPRLWECQILCSCTTALLSTSVYYLTLSASRFFFNAFPISNCLLLVYFVFWLKVFCDLATPTPNRSRPLTVIITTCIFTSYLWTLVDMTDLWFMFSATVSLLLWEIFCISHAIRYPTATTNWTWEGNPEHSSCPPVNVHLSKTRLCCTPSRPHQLPPWADTLQAQVGVRIHEWKTFP